MAYRRQHSRKSNFATEPSDVLRMGRYARASSWQGLRVTVEPSVSIRMIPRAGKLFPRRTHFCCLYWHFCVKIAALPPFFPEICRQHDRCSLFTVGVMKNASKVLRPVIPVYLPGPPVQWSSPAARFAPLTAPEPAAAD